MYLHLEAITIAEHRVRLLLQRAGCLQRKREIRTPSWNGGRVGPRIYLNIHGASSILIVSFLKDGCFPGRQLPGERDSLLPGRVGLT